MRSPIMCLLLGLTATTIATSCDAPSGAQGQGETEATPEDRGPLGKADNYGSCEDSTCDGPSPSGNCWCDDLCVSYGDCCDDKAAVCDGGAPSNWRDALPEGAVNIEIWTQGTTRHTLNGISSDSNPPYTFQRCMITGNNPGDIEVKCTPDGAYGVLAATVQADGTFAADGSASWRWEWSYDGELTGDGGFVIHHLELIEAWRNVYGERVKRVNANVGPLTGSL